MNFLVKEQNGVVKSITWKSLDRKTLNTSLDEIEHQEPPLFGRESLNEKVWEACSLVPEGVVVTYSEIAHAIGMPKAVRAVASALGRNPWAVKVPCHRIVGQSNLGGYSAKFGLKAKRLILKEEKKRARN
ncbi:MAG: MGMT family protein [Oligoflexia bacterium]|nr:MGMT family protein [Oligoflexia bacterium]